MQKIFISIAICLFAKAVLSQNIAVNTDGTSGESGVMLDVKGTNSISSNNPPQNIFQIKTFDANGLKMHMLLGTNSTAANTYGGLEVYDAANSAYRALALQPSGGNVGIGTTLPLTQALLDINAAPAAGNYKGLRVTSNGTIDGWFFLNNGANIWGSTWTGVGIGCGTGHPLLFGTNSTERMRISSTGYVGIGTTNPINILQIQQNQNALTDIWIENQTDGTASNVGLQIRGDNAAPGAYDAEVKLFAKSNSGVGAYGPASFAIGSNSNGGVNIFSSGGGSNARIGFFLAGTAAANEKVRIDYLGNMGIGTTNPQAHVESFTTLTGVNANVMLTLSKTGAAGDNNDIVFRMPNSAGGVASCAGLRAITESVDATNAYTGLAFITGQNTVTGERMRISTGGLVGIGATGPTFPLTINKDGIQIASSDWYNVLQADNGAASRGINFGYDNSTGNGIIAPPASLGIEFWGWNGATPAERMRLDGNGNFGIGTSPSERLTVYTPGGATPVGAMSIDVGSFSTFANSQASYFFRVRDVGGGSTLFYIQGDGSVGIGCGSPQYKLHVNGNTGVVGTIFATAASVSSGVVACSDIRYKKDISTLTNSLDNVLALRGVNYFWKTKDFPDKHFTDDKQVGFIAQEVEKIYPEIIFTDKDGYKSIDYSRLTPMLVEAIKEQQKIIDSMKVQIKNLEEAVNTHAEK